MGVVVNEEFCVRVVVVVVRMVSDMRMAVARHTNSSEKDACRYNKDKMR